MDRLNSIRPTRDRRKLAEKDRPKPALFKIGHEMSTYGQVRLWTGGGASSPQMDRPVHPWTTMVQACPFVEDNGPILSNK